MSQTQTPLAQAFSTFFFSQSGAPYCESRLGFRAVLTQNSLGRRSGTMRSRGSSKYCKVEHAKGTPIPSPLSVDTALGKKGKWKWAPFPPLGSEHRSGSEPSATFPLTAEEKADLHDLESARYQRAPRAAADARQDGQPVPEVLGGRADVNAPSTASRRGRSPTIRGGRGGRHAPPSQY